MASVPQKMACDKLRSTERRALSRAYRTASTRPTSPPTSSADQLALFGGPQPVGQSRGQWVAYLEGLHLERRAGGRP
jgi:hypothetical protein